MKSLSTLSELRQIAVKNTAVTAAGLRKLNSPRLYELTADESQASWDQIEVLLSSAMCIGFSGLISTIVPVGLGIIALWRTRSTSK